MQRPCDNAQDLVASQVAFAVVDCLEAVKIKQHHGERFASTGGSKAVLEEHVQPAPVAYAGERIGE
jgi:hypothetical protein